MNSTNIKVFAAFLLCVACAYANPNYCDSTSIDKYARRACDDLMSKRSIDDLTQLGYVVDDVKGGFLIVHVNPHHDHHFNSIDEEPSSAEIENDILSQGIAQPETLSASDRRHYTSNKFKRQTAIQGSIACCHSQTNCVRVPCA